MLKINTLTADEILDTRDELIACIRSNELLNDDEKDYLTRRIFAEMGKRAMEVA